MAKKSIPSYRKQKTNGGDRAFVELGGIRRYLGEYDSPVSRARYGTLIAEWESSGGHIAVQASEITIIELTARFWTHALTYYVKDGEQTSELSWIRSSIKPLVELYGSGSAANFGPLKLKTVRSRMISFGWTRKAINSRIDRIKRMFRWSTENEILEAGVYEAIRSVTGLRKDRSEAKESTPIGPVPEEHVLAVLPIVPAPVRGLIEFQLHTGCRPGEARIVRGIDINMSGPIWEYRPKTHKTKHHGHDRVIQIGPALQQILQEFLKADLTAYLFVPIDTGRQIVSPLYNKNAYVHAISRACKRANVPHWSPNQLRHLSGTRIRREAGLEGAQSWLGHRNAKTSEIYAEQSHTLARELAAKFG